MQDKDSLWRGTAHGRQFRVLAVEATRTVQSARDTHDLSPLSTLLLGKMISAAAMLSLDLKVPASEVDLRLEGDGPLKGALVIASRSGAVRGYSFAPQYFAEEAEDNFYPVRQLGNGILSVVRSVPGLRPSSGFTQLIEGEVAQNLAHYYDQSEQVPTAVNLGVLIDKEARIRAAGGFVIQQLPGADPHTADRIIAKLAQTPNVSDLMDMGLSIREILARFVFEEGEFDLREAYPIQYRCNCSKQRFERALRMLDRADLEDLRSGIDPTCHFCNTAYHFSGEEIAALLADKEADK